MGARDNSCFKKRTRKFSLIYSRQSVSATFTKRRVLGIFFTKMFRQIQVSMRSIRKITTSPTIFATKPIKPRKPKSTTPVGRHDQGPVSDSVSTSQQVKPKGSRGPVPQSYSRAVVSE